VERVEFVAIKWESVDKTPGTCYPVLDIGLPGRFFVFPESLKASQSFGLCRGQNKIESVFPARHVRAGKHFSACKRAPWHKACAATGRNPHCRKRLAFFDRIKKEAA